MNHATEDRAPADRLPDDDVIAILLEQHARVRDLFGAVLGAEDETDKRRLFHELRATLAVHEAGEEMVLRRASCKYVGSDVTEARNEEEEHITRALADLEVFDVSRLEFDPALRRLEQMVTHHNTMEEREEFPQVLEGCSPEQRRHMGHRLRTVEKFAPTRPHPGVVGSASSQWMIGPFASLLDRVKDAMEGVGHR
ncbi:hemerythrin domain-containing protein [Streptomyces sp. PTM05]|uniref:Hemerythrin domain-containing protein n=1 Tax=Streptantibioticus parmotrematis TaxID=2873249 RepID=A0ABS7QS07_9ACTN|nr:hemerythrin domain-containing protein [Streptantibioticus parmotrematis]MBY8885541.1 hemerythrin domain-containing protein [Streptantibioticus parmotrematis]